MYVFRLGLNELVITKLVDVRKYMYDTSCGVSCENALAVKHWRVRQRKREGATGWSRSDGHLNVV